MDHESDLAPEHHAALLEKQRLERLLSDWEVSSSDNFFDLYSAVLEFNQERLSLDIPFWPALPDAAERAELVGLIYEESREVTKNLVKGDLPEILDGVADLIYVLVGVARRCGVSIHPILAEVHRANMDKKPATGGFGRVTADGTATKHAEWIPPNVAGLLRLQGWNDGRTKDD